MNLIRAMQSEYSKCKRLLYWWALPLALALLVAAAISAFPVADSLANALAVAAFVIQVVVFVLRELAGHHQDLAEDIRRIAMLQDGLGANPSPAKLADLRDKVGDCQHNEPPFIDSYYDSAEEVGPRRLLDICAECAFFTGGNARRLAKILGWVSGAGLLIVLIGFVATVMAVHSTQLLPALARMALGLMAFFVSAEFTSMALTFWSLAAAMKHLVKDCERALQSDSEKELAVSAMALFADYNCAVAKAPPVPAWIYARYQRRMNDAWQGRNFPPTTKEQSGPSSPPATSTLSTKA